MSAYGVLIFDPACDPHSLPCPPDYKRTGSPLPRIYPDFAYAAPSAWSSSRAGMPDHPCCGAVCNQPGAGATTLPGAGCMGSNRHRYGSGTTALHLAQRRLRYLRLAEGAGAGYTFFDADAYLRPPGTRCHGFHPAHRLASSTAARAAAAGPSTAQHARACGAGGPHVWPAHPQPDCLTLVYH